MTSTLIHSELEENFLRAPSKVDEVMIQLLEIQQSTKMDAGKLTNKPDFSADLTNDNFIVLSRTEQTTRQTRQNSKKISVRTNLNKMSFMCQIDVSHEERLKANAERCRVATNYRRLGNVEYRRAGFDKAIAFYTKGLEYIPDSPVLFVNRSLCFIKKREFKRGIIDLEYVINNLDGHCLRAWLYKAGALKRMNDEAGFNESIATARRLNSNEVKYINSFLEKVHSDF